MYLKIQIMIWIEIQLIVLIMSIRERSVKRYSYIWKKYINGYYLNIFQELRKVLILRKIKTVFDYFHLFIIINMKKLSLYDFMIFKNI